MAEIGSPGDKTPAGSPPALHRSAALRGYLRSLRALDRNVRLFLTVTAFRGMVIATIQTVLNLYLYSLGYDARFIGVINGANAIAVLLVSVPMGYVADRIGRRPVLLFGGIAYPLSILGLSLTTSTPAILTFNFVFGAVSSAYWVAGIPLVVASTAPRQRVQAFSINSFLLWGVGPLGAFLSGQVVEGAGRVLNVSASSSAALRYGMLFMGLLALVGALPYPFLKEPPLHSSSDGELEAVSLRVVVGLFTKLLVPDAVLAIGFGAVLTFIQLYFHLRFHLDPGPVGLLVAMGGVVGGSMTLLVPLLARRWGNLRTAVVLEVGAVPMIVVLALATSLPLAIPAYLLLVALRGMNDPVYTAFVQERVPETYRARLTGFYSVTYSIGYSLGPALSGLLQKAGGFTPAFLLGACCYFIGSMLLLSFFGRATRATPEPLPA